jgi:hypothetical protein
MRGTHSKLGKYRILLHSKLKINVGLYHNNLLFVSCKLVNKRVNNCNTGARHFICTGTLYAILIHKINTDHIVRTIYSIDKDLHACSTRDI